MFNYVFLFLVHFAKTLNLFIYFRWPAFCSIIQLKTNKKDHFIESSMEAKILIVDSNTITRRSLTHQLVHSGCDFVEAENIVQVNQTTKRYEIEVALIALDSLRSEALLALQMIKSTHPDSEVILLTGPETLSLSIQGMRLGAFDDLMTPVEIEELLPKIRLARDKVRKKKQRIKKRLIVHNRETVNKTSLKENKDGKI